MVAIMLKRKSEDFVILKGSKFCDRHGFVFTVLDNLRVRRVHWITAILAFFSLGLWPWGRTVEVPVRRSLLAKKIAI